MYPSCDIVICKCERVNHGTGVVVSSVVYIYSLGVPSHEEEGSGERHIYIPLVHAVNMVVD